jgi:hypothetical protein
VALLFGVMLQVFELEAASTNTATSATSATGGDHLQSDWMWWGMATGAGLSV